jgi:hypothetical protein
MNVMRRNPWYTFIGDWLVAREYVCIKQSALSADKTL